MRFSFYRMHQRNSIKQLEKTYTSVEELKKCVSQTFVLGHPNFDQAPKLVLMFE